MKTPEVLHRAASVLAAALLGAIFVVILAQVVFRYALGRPLVWTEEAARYLYIWTCYLGIGMAVRHRTHIRIGALADRFGRRAAAAARAMGGAATLVFAVVLGLQGARLAWLSHSTLAITFPLPWSAIYAAAVASAVLLAVRAAEQLWKDLRRS